eukprot:7293298-Prymnesium_polylepis.1
MSNVGRHVRHRRHARGPAVVVLFGGAVPHERVQHMHALVHVEDGTALRRVGDARADKRLHDVGRLARARVVDEPRQPRRLRPAAAARRLGGRCASALVGHLIKPALESHQRRHSRPRSTQPASAPPRFRRLRLRLLRLCPRRCQRLRRRTVRLCRCTRCLS